MSTHLRQAWQHRRTLLKGGAIGLLVGLVVAISLPDEYECSIYTVQEWTNIVSRNAFNADDMAEETTIGGKRLRDAIMPSLYPKLLATTGFAAGLFDVPVQPASCPADSTITLYEYLNKELKYPWWTSLIRGIRKLTAPEDRTGKLRPQANYRFDDNNKILWLTAQETEIANTLKDRIRVEIESKKRGIIYTVRMQDPRVASTVADSLISRLRSYITHYRVEKEKKDLNNALKLRDEARQAYYDAQEKAAIFADRNRNLTKLTASNQLKELQIKKELAYKEYIRTNRLVQNAELRVNKIRPVFTVIDPAITPLHPVFPAVLKIMAVFGLIGMTVGYGAVWMKRKK